MATLAQPRRFASPEVRGLILARLGQLGALGFAAAAVLLGMALASYNPHDPSLNTSTVRAATNLAGRPGAAIADAMLQGFGAAAGLPIAALLAWAWRSATGRPLRLLTRVICTVLALPVLSAALAAWPGPATWPTAAGTGGAFGTLLANTAAAMGHGVLGAPGGVAVMIAGLTLLTILLILALGLTAGDVRSAGSGAAAMARGGADGVSRAGGAFTDLTGGSPTSPPVCSRSPTSPPSRPTRAPHPPTSTSRGSSPPSHQPRRPPTRRPNRAAAPPAPRRRNKKACRSKPAGNFRPWASSAPPRSAATPARRPRRCRPTPGCSRASSTITASRASSAPSAPGRW